LESYASGFPPASSTGAQTPVVMLEGPTLPLILPVVFFGPAAKIDDAPNARASTATANVGVRLLILIFFPTLRKEMGVIVT
jgi:hypothetical protein